MYMCASVYDLLIGVCNSSHGVIFIVFHSFHLLCKSSITTRYSVQHYAIKFVSDLRQVGGFL
jgi:hypothetical protein